MLTAYDDDEDVEAKCNAIGIVQVLHKPLSVEGLKDLLNKFYYKKSEL